MPKLLQINVTANWGSTGKIAEQIGVVAQKHGWDSYIAYGRYMNPSKNHLIKIGSKYEVYEHYIENIFFDNEGLASRRATNKFLKEIDRIMPDIVHLHNIHDHYINYELLFNYLSKKNIPVVWTQHDQWALTGHCCYIELHCNRWESMCFKCPISPWYGIDRSKRNHRLKKKLITSIPSLTIIPVSKWLADNVRQSYLQDNPIEVIHNGIDLETFRPIDVNLYENYGIASNKFIILGVAAVWDERKGLKDFYKLARMLPQSEYAIVIIGKVQNMVYQPDNDQDKMCKLVFVERTNNAYELAQFYSGASVFINPTYHDNYPTTNLEAMACGVPVITYSTGGSPESVDDQTGAVVRQGDVEGLCAKIKEFNAKQFKLNHTQDCRRKAENEFDKERCYKQYIKLYNRILQNQ